MQRAYHSTCPTCNPLPSCRPKGCASASWTQSLDTRPIWCNAGAKDGSDTRVEVM